LEFNQSEERNPISSLVICFDWSKSKLNLNLQSDTGFIAIGA